MHFLAYQRAQRLAVVTEDDRASKYLGDQVLGLSAPVPKPVSQQAVPAGTTDWGTYVKAALAGKPDTVYWAGSAAGGGAFLAALRAAGYDGAFVASAESESDEFLSAAGDAAEGAFVIAPATPAEPARGRRLGARASRSASGTRPASTRCRPTTACARSPRR